MTETNTTLLDAKDNTLKGWLQHRLSDERYQHSLGAQKKAFEIAQNFKLTPVECEKAAIAGLLHDCAKLMSPNALIEACNQMNLPITDEDKISPQTLHPFVGAEWVRQELGIADEEILNAIRYHTTGRQGMSTVEKVVYIADKIEENTRNPLYTQKITALFNFKDPNTLDKVCLYILDSTITFLIEKRQVIHTRTIEARNDLVNQLKEQRHLVNKQ